MLLRLILLAVLFYVVLSVLRAYFSARRSQPSRASKPAEGEEMVQDPQCLSYLPKSDAIAQAGKYFCSKACAKLFLER